ncbi:uncharacterized protein LOC132445789 isoform X3 [Gadus macrocephalus]|uniref:uncharacterized protein LOC132445789 isoform X3 n=1 Tax=Gadus macrocephalus TaxID=80720 RepID=UPI0028CB5099|nr:uncharacterized protein LOC132445789 isoform X3 [Gadus macrocephalus]
MSRDLYYPHSPESQDSPQRPYQPASSHVGPENVGEPSHMVSPGSTHASYRVYAGTSMNPSHIYPSMHPGSMGYIPVQSKPTTELETSIDVHITRTRQEAGLQSMLMNPLPDQNTHTTAWPLGSLDLAPTGYRSSLPISDGQFSRYSETMPSGAPNWHWPSGQQTSNYHSTKFSPTATNVPPSHYSQSSERYPVARHSSGDEYVSNNRSSTAGADSAPSPRSSLAYEHPSTSGEADNNQTRFTCESAMDILKRFDLQEEDLEDLCAYSEDQLSPTNLPFLLRDIRQKKAKNSSAASQSSTGHQAQGSQRAPETRVASGAEVKREAQAPPTFQQPSKVIEYGHTSTYSLGFCEEEKDGGHRSSSYMSQMRDTQPMDASPAKPGVPAFSNGSQRSNFSSAVYSHLPNLKASLSHRPATQLIQTSIASPKKEPIALQPAAPDAKPTATKFIPKRDSDADRMASSGCQKAALGAGITIHRPAPDTGTKSESPAPGTGTTSQRPAPGPRSTSHSPAPGVGTTIQKPAPGIGTFSHKPAPGPGNTSQRPAPATDPGPVPIPRSIPTNQGPIPTNQGPPPASDESIQRDPPVKPADERVPTAAMISDYMGVKPDFYPHTCSICNKPCFGMKGWLEHRNHIVHLARCRILRRQYSEWEPDTVSLEYSEWEPDTVSLDSAPEESQQPPTTTAVPASSLSSRPSLQATSHGGPAPSNSAPPLPRRTVEALMSLTIQRKSSWSKSSGGKGSRSPQTKGSRSPRKKRSRSPRTKRSRSPRRKRSRSKSSGRKRSSSRKRFTSPESLWHPDWKRTSGNASSPCSFRPIHSRRSRSRSSSSSSPSSDRNRGKRSSSPARRSKRSSRSPRRGRRTRSPRHARGTRPNRRSRSGSRSPHPSSKRRRSRSHDGRSSGRRQEETSEEQLAKKLLESSGVQSFTGSSSLELVVQSLAPVLLAELAKLKAASSSSSDSSKDQKKPSSSSSSSDEQKPSSSSSRDEKKPSSYSSSRDEQKPSSSSSRDKKPSSSSSRDEHKPSSSSSTDEKKPSSSSSSRDEQKPSSSSSRDKKPSSSSSRDEHKPSSSSSTDEKKPSSSSSSRDKQKQASTSLTKGGNEPPLSSSSVQGTKKVLVKKSVPIKSTKPPGSGLLGFVPAHPPLLLSGLPSKVTQQQVFCAVEKFGKSRLISVAQQRQVATVYFLQEAAAHALLGFTELKIGGNPITVTQIVVPGTTTRPYLLPTPGSSVQVQSSSAMAINVVAEPSSSSVQCNKTTAPGNNTTTTGTKGTTPGNKKATPGNATTTPGNKTTTPGNKTTTPGNKKTTPGKKTTMHANKMPTPSKSTTTPDNKVTTPGNNAATPGKNTALPGKAQIIPANETATPGNTTATPVKNTTMPGNATTLPDNKTTAPGNKTAILCKKTSMPSSTTTMPGSTSTPGNKMTTPGNKTATPGKKAATPGNKMAYTKLFPTVLFLKSIQCLDVQCWAWNDFLPYATSGATIMVTDLPEMECDASTWSSITQDLEKFGNVQCDKCFILPENCTAFLTMTAKNMVYLIEALVMGASLNSKTVRCHLLKENALESPITFYKHLLRWSEKLYDESTLEYRLMFISNIHDQWMNKICTGLQKNRGVKLFLPLIGKIFVEFVTVKDADRFGVWLAESPLAWEIHFSCPAHRTVNGPEDLEWAETNLTTQSVMVTGLAFGTYRHMDLVDEVWPYFVEKDISRVYYSVVILPRQRRAFIHFDDALKCKEFVSDFLHKPFTIGRSDLTLHFLLDHVKPCTSELQLYNRLLGWTNVDSKGAGHQEQLILKEMDYCSRDVLKGIFHHMMKNTKWVSCLVLANRVVFRLRGETPDIDKRTKVLNRLNYRKVKAQVQYGTNREVEHKVWKSLSDFTSSIQKIDVRTVINSPQHAKSGKSPPDPPAPGPSAPGPSGPGPSGPALLSPVAPEELCASNHDQDGLPGSGPQPPALSQEMYLFFATAIHQHHQARVGQEVRRGEQEVSRGGQEGIQRKQVSMDFDKTTSSSTSSGLKSNSSTTAHSSSLSGATVSSSSHLPKSSSSSSDLHKSSSSSSDLPMSSSSPTSSSLPPPVGVVPSYSEQNTQQRKCEESPAQVSEAFDTTHTPSPTSQEGSCITTTKEAESLSACPLIRRKEVLSEAAMVCEEDVARPGHMMAAETSAVKSAASLTGKDVLHTDPCLEEDGKRKAQQELTLTGKDVVVSPSEDMKENRVEVDETQEQLGDEKTSDQMLHSRPECDEETPHQTPVQPETPSLPDPESQTSERQEEEMLAKVADEAEPFQEVPEHKETILEEGKMTIVEEQIPSVNEETPSVVSEATDASLNGASTEEGDTNRLMDCVEGSPPKEEKQKTKETQEEEQKTNEQSIKEDQTNKEKNSKEPPEKEQGNKEQSNEAPTEGGDNKGPAVEEGAPEMDQRRSRRGHPSPVPPSTKPLSTRHSTRHSTPSMKREIPGVLPVEKAVSVEVEASSSPRGGESPSSGAPLPQGHPHPKEEEVEYQVTDSVEGGVIEGVQLPTRGKRGRPTKQTAKNVRVKKEQPTAPVAEESGKKPEEPLENQAGPTRKETKPQEAPEEKSRGKEDGAEESQMADIVTPSNAKPRVSDEGVSLEEVATYQVLDSVEDEELEVKEGPPVTRGTRGRGRKAKTPTRKECKRSLEETVFEVLDSIGGDVLEDAPAPEQPGRPRRGLANKDPTPEKDGKVVPDDTPEGTHGKQEQVKKEEEVARQFMEEPQGDEQPAAGKRRSGRGRKEEVAVSGTSKMAAKEGQQRVKEEEVYQVVDSTENDPHEEEHVDPPGPRRRSKRRDPAPTVTRAPRRPAYSTQGEEPLYQVVDSVGGEEEPAPVEEQPPGLEPRRGERGRKVAGSDSATEDKAAKKMKTTEQTVMPKVNEGVGAKKAMDGRKESQEQEENALVSLDEVSEEEEDYPDDSVEEEELRKRQTVEERRREEEERKLGEGMEGLVTLDEVGEEEVDEEEVGPGGEEESGRRAGGITQEELQALVTLDEIVEEEQEEEESTHSEPLPDDESEARLNTETVCDEEPASSSIVGECKQSEEQAEECVSFVTLDEVGYEEEEETQPRSKRERKCTRREQQQQQQQRQPPMAKPSGEESPPIPAHATSLLAGEPGAVLSVKGAEPMAESPAQDGEETGSEETRLLRKASSKARREEEGLEPKKVRSNSPSVANDYTLPAFNPNNPLGSEHVVPGFYCNLCSVFYKNETSARTLHCSRLGHYNNLKKYYQGLQEEQSRSESGGPTPGDAPK